MSKVNTANPAVESCKDGALGDFPGGPVVKAPLPMQGTRDPSLVEE